VSSLWEQRAARNEALFREVNENIAQLEERHGVAATEAIFICECANDGCTERLNVAPDVYRRVREQPRLFLVRPGHEEPQLERVVAAGPDWLIVEKSGTAREIAEQTR
jgi:hypothetical protein